MSACGDGCASDEAGVLLGRAADARRRAEVGERRGREEARRGRHGGRRLGAVRLEGLEELVPPHVADADRALVDRLSEPRRGADALLGVPTGADARAAEEAAVAALVGVGTAAARGAEALEAAAAAEDGLGGDVALRERGDRDDAALALVLDRVRDDGVLGAHEGELATAGGGLGPGLEDRLLVRPDDEAVATFLERGLLPREDVDAVDGDHDLAPLAVVHDLDLELLVAEGPDHALALDLVLAEALALEIGVRTGEKELQHSNILSRTPPAIPEAS